MGKKFIMKEKFFSAKYIIKLVILVILGIANYILLPSYMDYLNHHVFSLGLKTDNLLTLGYIIPIIVICLYTIIVVAFGLSSKNENEHSMKQSLILVLIYFVLCFAPTIRMLVNYKGEKYEDICKTANNCKCDKDKGYCTCLHWYTKPNCDCDLNKPIECPYDIGINNT